MDDQLWLRISAFQIDDPAAKEPFSKRLQKEQNWTEAFTQRAIEEYKRFMYLATTAGFAVTPSQIIDKVWHTHLIYTENYWKGLCEGLLGKDIHHIPGTGDPAEEATFQQAYEQTREAYAQAFGAPPPADIWTLSTPSAERKSENGGCLGFYIAGAVLAGILVVTKSGFAGFLLVALMLAFWSFTTGSSDRAKPTPRPSARRRRPIFGLCRRPRQNAKAKMAAASVFILRALF